MSTTAVAVKVTQFLKLRDYKKAAEAEFKKSMERVNEAMRVLEADMLKHLIETGADHIGCETGTVYRRSELTCTVDDRDAYLDWCVEQEEWEALDVKANKTWVKERLNAGGTMPPGVKTSVYETVGVRR